MINRAVRRRSAQAFAACLLAVSLIIGLTWALTRGAAAQGPALDEPARESFPHSEAPSIEANAEGIPLGEPGLSFRYTETFGITEEPYPADGEHLNSPAGIFIDDTDSLYVTEERGFRVLKYSPVGENILTIGQAGLPWHHGNHLSSPKDVAVDSAGNVWAVIDPGIRQFDPTGNLIQRMPEEQPWAAGDANNRFMDPHGLAFDSVGRLYVSDTGNHRIQVYTFTVDSDLVYSTTIGVTGEAGSDDDHFDTPRRLVVDSRDRLYVADEGNGRVQRCTYDDPVWDCTTFVDGLGEPTGVDVDNHDEVYVLDSDDRRVVKCSPDAVCEDLVVGLPAWSLDVAVDSDGNVYVSNWTRHEVRKYSSDGADLSTFVGEQGVPYEPDEARLNRPRGVDVAADGSIYVTEGRGFRVVKLNAAGEQVWTAGEAGVWGSDNGHFGSWWDGPWDVAVDAEGYVYVTDTGNNRVQILNPDGSYHDTFGSPGSGDYQFSCPTGIAISPESGNIFVADRCNHRIQVYDSERLYQATLGVTGEAGADDAHFDSPYGVAVDADGNVYVADRQNQRVQKCTLGGGCTTFVGEAGVIGDDFGHLRAPEAIITDAAGRVYVADSNNNRIQVFAPDGAYLTTIGGTWSASTGGMRGPSGIAIDESGTVYVADTGNHRIQTFVLGVPGWRQANINGFGSRQNQGVPSLAGFDGQLYAGTFNATTGAQVWRKNGAGGWTAVITDGFGTVPNRGIFDLVAFDGRLYAGTWNWDGDIDGTHGGEVWRSDDGASWEQVVDAGFGVPSNGAVFRLGVFKDQLYAGTVSFTDTDGGEIWRSATGGPDAWERVVENGLSDPGNSAVRTFEVFSDTLFAGISNYEEGGGVWRSSDGLSWTRVVTGGFGSAERSSVAALAAFQDHLYASTAGGAGAQVWRCQICDGDDWEKVVADGFGNSNNRWASALEVFNGRLYFVVGNNASGLEVWRTADGANWEQLMAGGFGDSNNAYTGWDNAATVFNGSLHLGMWNEANGGEVWQRLHGLFLPLVLRNK